MPRIRIFASLAVRPRTSSFLAVDGEDMVVDLNGTYDNGLDVCFGVTKGRMLKDGDGTR